MPMRDLWASTGLFNLAPISMTNKGLLDELADAHTQKTIMDVKTNTWLNYHSLLLSVPELGVLIPEHDLSFMSILNELFNCNDIFDERIRTKGERLRIERPHLHLIAGTQPKYMGALFPEAAYGMGFTARIIMIYAGEPVRVSLFTRRPERRDLRLALISDLKSIGRLQGPFNLAQETMDAIERWHLHDSDINKPTHSKLIHYSARRTMHLLKLSMIFSVSRSNDLIISLEDWHHAQAALFEVEATMPEIFKEISSGGQIAEMEEAFHFIMRLFLAKKKAVPERLLFHFLSNRVPANQINWLVDTMLRSGMIKEVAHPDRLNIPGRERFFEPLGFNKVED